MIEARLQPAGRIVARLAVLSATPIVSVVGRVTSVARRRRIAKCPVSVTVKTLRFAMTTDERVSGFVMIELDLLPTVWNVATSTFLTEETLVCVFRCVTGETVGRCVSVLLLRLMAISALGRCMPAEQSEVRVVVIEARFVEPDDVGIPAFMIGMTSYAVPVSSCAEQTVISRSAIDVPGHVFMTIQTKRRLLFAMKRGVAVITFALDLRVAFDDLAGHYQRLELR